MFKTILHERDMNWILEWKLHYIIIVNMCTVVVVIIIVTKIYKIYNIVSQMFSKYIFAK